MFAFLEKVAESKPKLIQFWTKKAYDREKALANKVYFKRKRKLSVTAKKLENNSNHAVIAEEVKILTDLLDESTRHLVGDEEFAKIKGLVKIAASSDHSDPASAAKTMTAYGPAIGPQAATNSTVRLVLPAVVIGSGIGKSP